MPIKIYVEMDTELADKILSNVQAFKDQLAAIGIKVSEVEPAEIPTERCACGDIAYVYNEHKFYCASCYMIVKGIL